MAADRFTTDLKYNFFGRDIVGRLILINCVAFVFVELVGVFLMLFNVPYNPVASYLSLPASLKAFIYQVFLKKVQSYYVIYYQDYRYYIMA